MWANIPPKKNETRQGREHSVNRPDGQEHGNAAPRSEMTKTKKRSTRSSGVCRERETHTEGEWRNSEGACGRAGVKKTAPLISWQIVACFFFLSRTSFSLEGEAKKAHPVDVAVAQPVASPTHQRRNRATLIDLHTAKHQHTGSLNFRRQQGTPPTPTTPTNTTTTTTSSKIRPAGRRHPPPARR